MQKVVTNSRLRFLVLKRSKRIHGRTVVESILKDGKSSSSKHFVLVKKENELPHHRYAFILSKKLERSAVKRNRKRRQVYEIIRLLEKENPVPSAHNYDMVLIARRPLLPASYNTLAHDLRSLLTTHS